MNTATPVTRPQPPPDGPRPGGAMAVLKGLETALVRVNQVAIVAMMMSMATLVFVNVVARYVFSASLNWSEEIARYLMIWVTYLGAGLAMREGQHVAIESGQRLLPRPALPWFRALVGLVILSFLVVLTVVGFQFAEFTWRQRTPVMQWSKGAMYLAVPIGAILFALHLVAVFRMWIHKSVDPEDEAAAIVGGEAS